MEAMLKIEVRVFGLRKGVLFAKTAEFSMITQEQ